MLKASKHEAARKTKQQGSQKKTALIELVCTHEGNDVFSIQLLKISLISFRLSQLIILFFFIIFYPRVKTILYILRNFYLWMIRDFLISGLVTLAASGCTGSMEGQGLGEWNGYTSCRRTERYTIIKTIGPQETEVIGVDDNDGLLDYVEPSKVPGFSERETAIIMGIIYRKRMERIVEQ